MHKYLLLGIVIGAIIGIVASGQIVEYWLTTQLKTTTIEETITETTTKILYLPTTITKTYTLTTTKLETLTSTYTETTATTITETYTVEINTTRTIIITKTTTATYTHTTTQTETITLVLAPTREEQNRSRLYFEEPTIEKPGNPVVELDSFKLYVDNNYVYFEITSSSLNYNYLYIFVTNIDNQAKIALSPECIDRKKQCIESVYFYINKTYLLEVFRLRDIVYSLGRGEYVFTVYLPRGYSVSCSFSIVAGEGIVFSRDCRETTYIPSIEPPPLLGSFTTIIDTILYSFTEETLSRVAEIIYNDTISDESWIVWRVLEWVDRNIEYDYFKAGLEEAGVYTPLELLEVRKGICSDYSVFIAAALLSMDLDTYILVLPEIEHAVAATQINNTFFVLDQHLPPIELQDYLEHKAQNVTKITIYHLHLEDSSISISKYTIDANRVVDTYPEDRLSQELVVALRNYVADTTHTSLCSCLDTVIASGVGARLDLGNTTKFYHPLFTEQWKIWIGRVIVDLLEKYYREALGQGTSWIAIDEEENRTSIYVYAIPIKNFTVSVQIGENITVEVESPLVENIVDVSILAYTDLGEKPCAGIVPPGYEYQNIPYVEAESWILLGDRIEITISKTKLEELLASTCRRDTTIIVFLLGHPIYALRITLQE